MPLGGSFRGFPFDGEDLAGAWSSLAARHPDIAARLRQRPATWARKRRPPSQTTADGCAKKPFTIPDFDDNFEGFDRFPFDDIPPEFRDHFPTHWNRGFGSREEQPHSAPPPEQQQHQPSSSQQQKQPSSPPHQKPSSPQQQKPSSPQHQTTSTQTEHPESEQPHLPQYGLRNTVDLGQKSATDPSVVDAEERTQRSMSAPPDNRTMNQEQQAPEQPSNVRHIPIFVEGRDEPVINKNVDHGAHYADPKPQYASPPKHPQQTHIDRDQYFADDGPVSFHHTPNFSRAFGTPFNKNYRQGPQPFVQQKVYPQTAFARGASPARSESPKPQAPPDEHYVKVPVHHEPQTSEPTRVQKPQPPQPPPRQPSPQQPAPPQPQPASQQPKPQPSNANDPISQILIIQTDVLNLMSEVENFGGAKNDKQYLFLDEMLTRNLIKLDNIETEGKENIRQARKEAIKCIQKCIAVLEAKAESNSKLAQGADVDMKEGSVERQTAENGEVEAKEPTKDDAKKDEQVQPEQTPDASSINEAKPTPAPSDTRPDDKAPAASADACAVDNTSSPKKGTKAVKKRDKSKDNANKDKETKVGTNKNEQEAMQVDDKGDRKEPNTMDVDGAAASQ